MTTYGIAFIIGWLVGRDIGTIAFYAYRLWRLR